MEKQVAAIAPLVRLVCSKLFRENDLEKSAKPELSPNMLIDGRRLEETVVLSPGTIITIGRAGSVAIASRLAEQRRDRSGHARIQGDDRGGASNT
jgi:hypothetical protein